MTVRRTLLLPLLAALTLTSHAADTYKIDPVHSSIVFGIMHLGVTNVYGRFNDVSGNVVFDKENPAKSSIELEVKVDSVDTHEPKRDQHLKSPDFFNAKQFPVMAFKSTKVQVSGNDYKITGEFTLHGVTKPITIDFKKGAEAKGMQGELRAGGETQFTVKRSDYGMKFMPDALGDEVKIIVSLEGIKQ
jgi:polyisoprenoid-binding protein YceI